MKKVVEFYRKKIKFGFFDFPLFLIILFLLITVAFNFPKIMELLQ